MLTACKDQVGLGGEKYPSLSGNPSETGCCEHGQGRGISSEDDIDHHLVRKFLIKKDVASVVLRNTLVTSVAGECSEVRS
jgi:hypothetical protein